MTRKHKIAAVSVGALVLYLLSRKAHAAPGGGGDVTGTVELGEMFSLNGRYYYTDGGGEVPRHKWPQ